MVKDSTGKKKAASNKMPEDLSFWVEKRQPYTPSDPTEREAYAFFIKKHARCKKGHTLLIGGDCGIGKNTVALCWGCKKWVDLTNYGIW